MRKSLAPKILIAAGTVGLPLFWFACSSTNPGAEAASSGPSAKPGAPAAAAHHAAMTPKELEAGFKTTLQPYVQQYCLSCHGADDPEAELDLSKFDSFASVTKHASRWLEILDRVKAGEMPPDDADKLPSTDQTAPVIAWLESMHAAEVARTAGDPGMVLARRLSNAEYDYTIRDLTGANIRPTKEFPVDPANTAGFDNSGESLAMSPSMVQKYLEAARAVANNVVFTPDGLAFAEYPVVTEEDRNKYAVNRIIDFYNSFGKTIDNRYDNYMARSLDYADYFVAAWRYQNRAALGRRDAKLADFATEAKVSPKYLETVWTTLTASADTTGPLAALQARWKKLPAATAGQEPADLRAQAESMRDLVIEVRGLTRMSFPNLIPNSRIVNNSSQAVVLAKDRLYANARTTYNGNATKADFAKFKDTDPALAAPAETDTQARAAYEDGFKRFATVFPDAFFVTVRARMHLSNQRDIVSDLSVPRLLTAGFHSQEGYFRDDKPLYDMVLNDAQRQEIDRLWRDLDYIAQAPITQYRQNIWFERAEPPSVMVDPMFASFRSADADITSEARIKQFGEVYVKRAESVVVYIEPPGRGGRGGRGGGPGAPAAAAAAANATPNAANAAANPAPAATPAAAPAPAAPAAPAVPNLAVGTSLNYIAPSGNSPATPRPEGATEFRLSPEAVQAFRDYFVDMNARIRAVEAMGKVAEPLHIQALVDFAERASRRPLSQAEKDDVVGFYQQLRKENLSHEDAIRDSIVSVLMSPSFAFRADIARNDQTIQNGVQPLSDIELANRLSYFLWSSMPDAELMAHARKGDLRKPEVLAAQTRRMLRDDRVRALATEFGANWLDVRRFEKHNAVDRERFPMFTNELREAMFEEPVQFITHVAQRNGSILDFIYGDYTFVNGPLAKHYGMPAPAQADQWVRVDDAGKYQRGGLLPMSVFLTKNAPGLRTSPVKRGHWVVSKILGEHIPAPPPDVPQIPPDESQLGGLSLRQTLAKHREDKSCASCHNKFDSMGLVFEGYGPVGETRELDLAGKPTEINAEFPDGVERSGLAGLKAYIKTKTEHEFVENLSKKMLAYALGRSLMPSDTLVVADVAQKLAANGYHFDTLVTEIVMSRQFLHKRISADTESISAQ